MSVSGTGNSTYTFDTATNILVIVTAQNSELTIDLDSGNYSMAADSTITESYTENIGFSLIDNDGDQASAMVTFNIDREVQLLPELSNDTAQVDEAAMITGTDSASDAEVATGNIFSNDTIPDLTTLTDVTIAGGTTDTNVAGEITVTTAEGNTLVVDTDSGDYTYTLINALEHEGKTLTGDTIILANDDFEDAKDDHDDWVLSKEKDNKDGQLEIEGKSNTASKIFDFGSDYANETVNVQFDFEASKEWDAGNDTFRVDVNSIMISDIAYGGGDQADYNFDITLDENGQASFVLTTSNDDKKEKALIDDFTITGPEYMMSEVDTLIDSFTYTVTDFDGVDYSSNLDVTILDDKPTATPAEVNLVIEPITTNIAVIVDISSSMSNEDLKLTEDAIEAMITAYGDLGNVNVNIVQFYGNGNIQSGWIDADSGKALTLDTTKSGTDPEQGMRAMVENSYSGNQPTADQDVMYFFGDGDSYNAYESDFDAYLPTWNNFVNSGQIDKLFSYSVNTSSVLSDIVKIADNGENVVSQDAVNIDNVADLSDAVSSTAVPYVAGNLTSDVNGVALLDFGADGGHIETIIIGANSATYDENNIVQTISGEHGDFEINFDTGSYRYMPTDTVDSTETIEASIVDADGDSFDAILVSVNIEHAVEHNFDNTAPLDGGDGFDTVILDTGINLNFDDATMQSLSNIEKIDMVDGDHAITNLSLSDVLDMTDPGNTLEITGDDSDTLDINTSGWTQQSTVDNGDNTTYNYTTGSDGSGDSISLTVDDEIITTGM